MESRCSQEGSTRSWEHLTQQTGMFCYTGLSAEEVEQLMKKHSVYLTKDERISVAAISSDNVAYVAKAIHDVTK